MNRKSRPTMNPKTAVLPREAATSDFLADVIEGLSHKPRTLPCKYFYDARGAQLFQKICELPEYYITRTEIDILDRHGTEIASELGPDLEVLPVCADYLQAVVLPAPRRNASRKVVYFPGSTIGNFEPAEALEFFH